MEARIIYKRKEFILRAGKKGTGRILFRITCWDNPTAQHAAIMAVLAHAKRIGVEVVE